VAIEFFIGRARGDLHFVVADCPDCVTAKRVAAEFAGGMSVENADFAARNKTDSREPARERRRLCCPRNPLRLL